jgi:TPR repeat protein
MSQPFTPAVNLTPLTSTAQTDAVLVNTTDSNPSSSDNPAPSLHNTQTPPSPFENTNAATAVDISTHTAPVARTQMADTLAANWFRMAAERGDSSSQFNLGVMYEFGNGVTQDINRAIRWYHLAAQQGHVEAMGVLRILQSDLISSKMEGA